MNIRSKLSAHILRMDGLAISLCWGIVSAASSLAVPLPNSATSQSRTLSFADRVAYQYAIEEVYWRHRIWPRENSQPKPALDEAISPAQIEQKVRDYLRNSQALEDYWHQPLSPEQLQAEMERMAQNTKQPEVLHELFAALGNDPYVIAECLARPALSERLVTTSHITPNRAEIRRAKVMAAATADYRLPAISDGANGCTDNIWTATSTINAPSGRIGHTAVWTGSEMIVWGGVDGFSWLNTGGRYNPSMDSWTATSATDAPTARSNHTTVWTGSEMIVWGGLNGSNILNTGGGYNPSTDSWTATSTTNAPAARYEDTAVWSGSEMIIWGGDDNSSYFNTGGRYSPGTDSWTATSTTNAPTGRAHHTAVWTGNEMIVWGYSTGGRYNPGTDSWTATSTTNAPAGRAAHTAVWTGSEMIVWGGVISSGYTNTGGRYSPGSDSWTATSATCAPAGRVNHTAVWTGNEMIVFGGNTNSLSFNTGGRYSQGTDSWTATSTINAPSPRTDHTAVWTGNEMIVWGGDYPLLPNTGGRYCAQTAPVPQSAFSRKIHGGAGPFDVSLLNNVEDECRSGGATNDYQMIMNFATSVTVESASVTCATGSVSSFSVNGSQVTVNLTGVTNVQRITVTLVNVNDGSHAGDVPISMGVLVGDVDGNAVVDASDVSLVKAPVGQLISESNFRADVTASSSINAGDVAQVKVNVGTALP